MSASQENSAKLMKYRPIMQIVFAVCSTQSKKCGKTEKYFHREIKSNKSTDKLSIFWATTYQWFDSSITFKTPLSQGGMLRILLQRAEHCLRITHCRGFTRIYCSPSFLIIINLAFLAILNTEYLPDYCCWLVTWTIECKIAVVNHLNKVLILRCGPFTHHSRMGGGSKSLVESYLLWIFSNNVVL